MRKLKAFTVAELITVLAIIGILAALAVPNFMEAYRDRQSRKVSRIRTDQRSLATGLESYFVDNNSYPAFSVNHKENAFSHIKENIELGKIKNIPTFRMPNGKGLLTLTTPVAYITNLFPDPLAPVEGITFAYYTDGAGWITWSPGRDGDYDMDYDAVKKYYISEIPQPSADLLIKFAYDPSNGTESSGDIFRVKQ